MEASLGGSSGSIGGIYEDNLKEIIEVDMLFTMSEEIDMTNRFDVHHIIIDRTITNDGEDFAREEFLKRVYTSTMAENGRMSSGKRSRNDEKGVTPSRNDEDGLGVNSSSNDE
jgi:hypothetical protein